MEKGGAGIWFAAEITAELSSHRTPLPLGLRKGNDTLDVWIDSGTSWAAVVAKRPELRGRKAGRSLSRRQRPASRLVPIVAAHQRRRHRRRALQGVLTNGFVVDQERKKLSKSNEGYQKPVDLMSLVNEHGADVLRLWVASQDYQDDIPFSHDILARVADTYRSVSAIRCASCWAIWPILITKIDAVAPMEQWTDVGSLCIYAAYVEPWLQRKPRKVISEYQFSQVYQLDQSFLHRRTLFALYRRLERSDVLRR